MLTMTRLCLGLLWLILVLALCACTASKGRGLAAFEFPVSTRQVLLSTTENWSATVATVQRFERTPNDSWLPIGKPIRASVGRSGLGWGIGMHRAVGEDPQKREGDGRAPAGVFALGTAFGYAETAPAGVSFPYRHATDRDYFVDGADSPAYNQWQRIPDHEPNDPKRRWSSCERMRRDDAVYEFGVVVEHNMPKPVPGRGSAIFLHVWAGPEVATSGCTAMAREDLLEVLCWLRADAKPVLVQMPSDGP